MAKDQPRSAPSPQFPQFTSCDEFTPDGFGKQMMPIYMKALEESEQVPQSLRTKWSDNTIRNDECNKERDTGSLLYQTETATEKGDMAIHATLQSVSSSEFGSIPNRQHARQRLHTTEKLDSSLRRIIRFIEIPPKLALILGCFVVSMPMAGFSIIIVALVFANKMEKATCPYPELCPSLNTTKSDFYYVDFSATRLVFVASWSSSISLVLVNMLMMMFSYSVCREITTTTQHSKLPTPYQTTILMKTLNGELGALVDFFVYKFKNFRFQRGPGSPSKIVPPPMLLRALGVFSTGIFLSLLIQAADTWLHISTDTAPLIHVQQEHSGGHHYSRLLHPTGFNDTSSAFSDSKWSMCNKYLWGYSIDCTANNWNFRNRSSVFEIRAGRSSDSDIFNYTDDQGTKYAILGPSGVNNTIDWTATSFGASTSQCRPLPQVNCNSSFSAADGNEVFNCINTTSGINFAGSFDTEIFHLSYLDFHSTVNDAKPFSSLYSGEKNVWFSNKMNPIPAPSENDTVFSNPWRWVALFSLLPENPFSDSQDPLIWRINNDGQAAASYVMITCETTIWDVMYDFVDGSVRNMSRSPSNSLTTGTANMPSVGFFDHSYTYLNTYFEINVVETSIDDMINTTAFSFSKDFTSVLGAQTASSPAVKAQSRNTLLVSQVPKSALWTLIVANLVYALLGIVLAVFAFRAFSQEVHQVNVHFGLAGLVAGLFEKPHANKPVGGETELFRENEGNGSPLKRIYVRRTDEGGAELVAIEGEEENGPSKSA